DIGVVVDVDLAAESFAHLLAERHMAPARKIGRAVDDPGLPVHRTGRTDSDREDVVDGNADLLHQPAGRGLHNAHDRFGSAFGLGRDRFLGEDGAFFVDDGRLGEGAAQIDAYGNLTHAPAPWATKSMALSMRLRASS